MKTKITPALHALERALIDAIDADLAALKREIRIDDVARAVEFVALVGLTLGLATRASFLQLAAAALYAVATCLSFWRYRRARARLATQAAVRGCHRALGGAYSRSLVDLYEAIDSRPTFRSKGRAS